MVRKIFIIHKKFKIKLNYNTKEYFERCIPNKVFGMENS